MFSHIIFKPSLQQNNTTTATITDKEELLRRHSFGSISKKLAKQRALNYTFERHSEKDSYMQKLARTFFDFSIGNIQVVELRSEMKWTQNLSGKVVELLSETEGTQNLSGNFVCLKF